MPNMVKRTFSQQKFNLPMKMEENGKYLKEGRHSSWDLTQGSPITIDFAQISAQTKRLLPNCHLLSVNCMSDVLTLKLRKRKNGFKDTACWKSDN
jgi:hypothetical protein